MEEVIVDKVEPIITEKKEEPILIKYILDRVQHKNKNFVMLFVGPTGCLSGDTIINTSRNELGRPFALKYLYNALNGLYNPKGKGWDLSKPTFIRSFNGEIIKLNKIKDVTYSGIKKVYKLILENGLSIKATNDHKFMTKENGWTELSNLKNKEVMCDTLNSKFSKVLSIEYFGEEETYDIECEEPNHNFVANGMIVHNSGKSYAALRLAEQLDPTFDITRCSFKAKDFMNTINDLVARSEQGEEIKGKVILWDEFGVEHNAREFMTISNRVINYFFQTSRHLNLIVIMTVPLLSMIDSATRKLSHGIAQMCGLNSHDRTTTVKVKMLQVDVMTGKEYPKYLRYRHNGKGYVAKKIKFHLPSKEISKLYEQKKKGFTTQLNKDIMTKLLKSDEKDKIQEDGAIIKCPNPSCGYEWRKRRKDPRLCPKCRERLELFKKPGIISHIIT